jgi:hypothetical protein
MKIGIPAEGVLVGALLSYPAIRAGFAGSLSLDAVLFRFLVAVLVASVACQALRALFGAYAQHEPPDRRRGGGDPSAAEGEKRRS